jgi:hypothetical protein
MTGVGIKSILNNSSAITTAVGTRIYPNQLPQQVSYPAIYYGFVEAEPLNCRNPQGYDQTLLEVGVWSKTYEQTRNIIKDIKECLDGYNGTSEGEQYIVYYKNENQDEIIEEERLYSKSVQFTVYGL